MIRYYYPSKGDITLSHNCANSLDPSSEHLFWAIVAFWGLTMECITSQAPVYMYIDEAYHEWVNHLLDSLENKLMLFCIH
jgi:hypothetical protein